jgi:hypothetical protein
VPKGVNFAKDNQKDSYNNKKFIKKNLKRIKTINHIEKTFVP